MTHGKGSFLRWNLRLVCSRMKGDQEGRGTETGEETRGERGTWQRSSHGGRRPSGPPTPPVASPLRLVTWETAEPGRHMLCHREEHPPWTLAASLLQRLLSSAHPPRLPAAGKGPSHKQKELSQPSLRLWNSMCGLRNCQTKTPHPILRNLICSSGSSVHATALFRSCSLWFHVG